MTVHLQKSLLKNSTNPSSSPEDVNFLKPIVDVLSAADTYKTCENVYSLALERGCKLGTLPRGSFSSPTLCTQTFEGVINAYFL